MAILRGGIYPALVIAGRLGVEKVYTITLRKYSDEKPPSQVHREPVFLGGVVPNLGGDRVLIVDDVARTGSTLSKAKSIVMDKDAGEVRTAVLVLRSRGLSFMPDYYGIYMSACPLFPWER